MAKPRTLKAALREDYVIDFARQDYDGKRVCVQLKPRFWNPSKDSVVEFYLNKDYFKRNFPQKLGF